MRTLATAIIIFGIFGAIPAADPLNNAPRPTEVKWDGTGKVLGHLADELTKKTGVPVTATSVLKSKCEVKLAGVPFWEALETCAAKTGTRVRLADGGRAVELVPRGVSREVAATSGAFRLVAQQTVGRAPLDSAESVYEVQLLVHWEPRVRVYKMDSAPRITGATDDRGSKITADAGSGTVHPEGPTRAVTAKLRGATRKSERITSLRGEFTAVAADRLLAFEFATPGGKLPPPQTQAGATASLKRLQKKGTDWEVEVEVSYPPGQPVFESHEEYKWLRDNRLLLRSPDGKSVSADDYEVLSLKPLVAVHRFAEDPKAGFGNPTAEGWKVVYETPAPLAEVRVPFDLKDIPLP